MRIKVLTRLGVGGAVLLVTACGAAGTNTGTGGVRGSVVVSGSSTVQPISSLVAETFSQDNPEVQISVDGPGTGDGFELFCNGETDINDASRKIEPEEKTACDEAGVRYTELEIGLDGITVMTNPANGAVTCLTKPDLYALFGPESQGFDEWSDASALAQKLGGNDSFPNLPLEIVAPGEESGTYDAFIELALGDIIEERGKEEALRPDYQSSPNDNVIIQAMEGGSGGALGFVGFAYAENNAQNVKILQIDGGSGCVAPFRETIANGTYPLSRSLYLYVNTDNAKRNKALAAFVDFYLSDAGIKESVAAAGYVDLPQSRIETSRSAWGSV